MYDHFQQQGKSPFTISDLLRGKDLEIVAASLLLLGKLKVESVQIYRSQPIIFVTLIGEFNSEKDNKKETLADFLERSGDVSFEDMVEGLKNSMKKQ